MKDDVLEILIILFLLILFIILGFMAGNKSGAQEMQKTFQNNAISAGVAHWTVNPTNGVSTFEFITLTNK